MLTLATVFLACICTSPARLEDSELMLPLYQLRISFMLLQLYYLNCIQFDFRVHVIT